MKLMFLVLSLIVSLTGCGSSGNRGGASAENIGPIVSLGADIKKSPPDIKLDQMGRVIEINLADKAVTNEDLKVIAQYKHLQILKIPKTSVTNEGLPNLFPLRKLRVIMLSDTAVNLKGLHQLVKMPSLRDIYVWPMKITAEEYKNLKVMLPDVKVHD